MSRPVVPNRRYARPSRKNHCQKPLGRIVARRPNLDRNWDDSASQIPHGRAKNLCPKWASAHPDER